MPITRAVSEGLKGFGSVAEGLSHSGLLLSITLCRGFFFVFVGGGGGAFIGRDGVRV